jgi:hypothetical protein
VATGMLLAAVHAAREGVTDGPRRMAFPDVAFSDAWTTVRGRGGKPALYLLQLTDTYAAYALAVARPRMMGQATCECFGPTCRFYTMRPPVLLSGGTTS